MEKINVYSTEKEVDLPVAEAHIEMLSGAARVGAEFSAVCADHDVSGMDCLAMIFTQFVRAMWEPCKSILTEQQFADTLWDVAMLVASGRHEEQDAS